MTSLPRKSDPILDLLRRQRALGTRSPGVRVNARGTGRTRSWATGHVISPVTITDGGKFMWRVTNDTLYLRITKGQLQFNNFWTKFPGEKAKQQPIAKIGKQGVPARPGYLCGRQFETISAVDTLTFTGALQPVFMVDTDGCIYYLTGLRAERMAFGGHITLG